MKPDKTWFGTIVLVVVLVPIIIPILIYRNFIESKIKTKLIDSIILYSVSIPLWVVWVLPSILINHPLVLIFPLWLFIGAIIWMFIINR